MTGRKSVVVVGAVNLQAIQCALLAAHSQIAGARWIAHHSGVRVAKSKKLRPLTGRF